MKQQLIDMGFHFIPYYNKPHAEITEGDLGMYTKEGKCIDIMRDHWTVTNGDKVITGTDFELKVILHEFENV